MDRLRMVAVSRSCRHGRARAQNGTWYAMAHRSGRPWPSSLGLNLTMTIPDLSAELTFINDAHTDCRVCPTMNVA
jgi:hypothetical protein